MADRDEQTCSSWVPGTEPASTQLDEQQLAPEDFYFEGQYMVFTEAYHRKRGYCCNSGCRHCPYR